LIDELEDELEVTLRSRAPTSKPTVTVNGKELSIIPHPKGTAGQDFSIQVAMKLVGSDYKDQFYKGTLVSH
jgi:hypothetical protein